MDESFKEIDNSSTDVQFDDFDNYDPWVSICQEGTDHLFVCANVGIGRITFSLSEALFCYIILCYNLSSRVCSVCVMCVSSLG